MSNEAESKVDIYFDDMKIVHTKTDRVVQSDDYYLFGLTMNGTSYQRLEGVKNKFKFQDQELQDDLDLGWYSFKWRNHDPAIGRFFNVDPLAEDYVKWSPYVFRGNRVTGHCELEGLEPVMSTKYRDRVMKEKKKAEVKVNQWQTLKTSWIVRWVEIQGSWEDRILRWIEKN